MIPKPIHMAFQAKALRSVLGVLVLMLFSISAFSQEKPPQPLIVTTFQNLSFGAIIQGNTGGQVIIDPQGSRSVTGDIIPVYLGYQYYPAIFEIEANPGSIINIVNGPDVILTGNNGGNLTMHIGSSIPTSPFINTMNQPSRTQVRIGGTLFIGNRLVNPSGDYIGYFSITFVQQ